MEKYLVEFQSKHDRYLAVFDSGESARHFIRVWANSRLKDAIDAGASAALISGIQRNRAQTILDLWNIEIPHEYLNMYTLTTGQFVHVD